MGTNYYMVENCCEKCGRGDEKVHIGKSSMGWPFSVHIIPEMGLNNWKEWVAFLLANEPRIVDEYGRETTITELDQLVKDKRKHAKDEHVLRCYADYPQHCKLDPETGDKLSSGEYS